MSTAFGAIATDTLVLSAGEVTAEIASSIAGTKLDDLLTPDDNTDLNASTSAHGLLPKLSGNTAHYLRGDGAFATPPGGSEAFPVGAVFIAVVNTNPATLLGYGTWSAFAAGRMLVGIDAGQTEFDVVKETGGTKTHTLTTAEIPAHTHIVTSQTASTGGATSYEHGTLDTSSAEAEATEVTGSTGGGGAHNNLPPYIVVYMWERTA